MATSKETPIIPTPEQEAIIQNLIAIHEHEGVRPDDSTIELGRLVITDQLDADAVIAQIIAES